MRPPGHSNKEKMAIVLLALGNEATSQIFHFLTEEEVEQIMLEIARLGKVDHTDRNNIIAEFRDMCTAQEFISQGGIEHAKKFLESAYGTDKANGILNRVIQALQVMPFDFAKKADPTQLLSYLQEEHPQTVALILAHLPPKQSAAVLSGLPQEVRAEVARRIAIMDRTPPEVVKQIETVLEKKLSSIVGQTYTSVGGVKALVDVINFVDRQTEKTILESLTENNPELADEVKKLMFVFEDITTLDDSSIQKILREVEIKELGLALKAVSDDVQNRILKNMSERAANMLREDMEFMGPVRLRSVEEAQQRIVGVVRRLEDAGEIIVSRGNGEEMIV